jgi:hypothetical protein
MVSSQIPRARKLESVSDGEEEVYEAYRNNGP